MHKYIHKQGLNMQWILVINSSKNIAAAKGCSNLCCNLACPSACIHLDPGSKLILRV